VDNIRVVKILGAGVGSSHVMNGMVFRRGAEGDIKNVSNARVAVFACPFDLTQTETKVVSCLTYASLPLILGNRFDEQRRRFVAILKDRRIRS
jgi:chaperonin GroEL (HSP60 family)